MLRTQSPARRPIGWADAVILVTVMVWGVNFVVVKIALTEFTPLAFNAVRFTLGALCEVGILLAAGENVRVTRGELRALIPLALGGVVLYQLGFAFGIGQTSAGNASVLLATVPIFVALHAGLIQRIRLGRHVWIGALLTLAGILLLTFGSGKLLSASLRTLPGSLLLLLSALAWASYIVGSKSAMQHHTPFQLTAATMLIATPVLDVLAIPELLAMNWTRVSAAAWGGLAFSAVFSLALAYLFWNIGVQRLGGTRASVYSNLTPIVSLAAGWLILGERLAWLQALGALVVLGGVGLARFGGRNGRFAPETATIPSEPE